MSRHAAVTEGVIDRVQDAWLRGDDLGHCVPGWPAGSIACAAVESLEADALLDLPPEELLERVDASLGDWSIAILAELLLACAVQIQAEAVKHGVEDTAWSLLERVIDSPTASPLLWYESIYTAIAEQRAKPGPRRHGLLIRSLAHDLAFHDALNAKGLLHDIVLNCLWGGDRDRGLAMLARLLRNDPADIDHYNLMAVYLGPELASIAQAAGLRGLRLIKEKGDTEAKSLESQIRNRLDELEGSLPVRDPACDPRLLEDLRVALALDFERGEHRPLPELSLSLIPEMKAVRTKEPRVVSWGARPGRHHVSSRRRHRGRGRGTG